MSTLLLNRHAESSGQAPDAELTALGVQQADSHGNLIASILSGSYPDFGSNQLRSL